ncbi:MAG: hypothetical protein Q9191_004015 [Dirinaria sp. TL-2023a]
MESEAKESSQSPSGHRLKNVLSKTRRGRRDDNASTLSVVPTENSSDGNGRSVRSSLDSLRRASRQSSLDDGSGGASLKKLIPGRAKRKRKKREAVEAAERQQLEEEGGRGRDTNDQAATAAMRRAAVNRSHSTLDDGEGSSLITVDSEAESPLGSPPPLVSRQSHIGYLTASSPLIKTSTAAGTTGSEPSNSDGAVVQHPPQKSSTFPENPFIFQDNNLAPRHAATLGPQQDEKSSKRSSSRESRGISPGSRVRDIFSTGSPKEGSAFESSEGEPAKLGGTGALGAMLNKEKRNSMSVHKGSKPSNIDSGAAVTQLTNKDGNRSLQNLPQITTSPKSTTSTLSSAPTTTITPPTPTDASPNTPNGTAKTSATASKAHNTSAASVIAHRRGFSDSVTHSPSKLSNAMAPPLTPTVEEARTPSGGARTPGSSGSPGGAGGFFSSVFSAAQSAATTLTNTIANNPQRSRSSTQTEDNIPGDQDVSVTGATDGEDEPSEEKKPLAVDTLGSGDLSLSHLGISSDAPATNTSATGTFPQFDENSVLRDEAAARAEDASAARAVSAAYSEKAIADMVTPVAEDNAPLIRPRSNYEPSIPGDKTPPTGSIFEGESGFRRSGSVRSKVGAVARRKRNSSTATSNTAKTIAAAIGAGHAALANPALAGSTPKLTGFAVANKKRNRDYHQLFKSVPEDDYLIEDYSCALQREIILAGRIYISEGHICFSSNILGWVTILIISFDEVVSVEKEFTAMVFPNAIAIQTLHAKHTFRSLLSREATYELIIGIWKLTHPNLMSTENGARLNQEVNGEKAMKVDPSVSEGSEVSDDDEVYDEDEEAEGSGTMIEAENGEAVHSEVGEPLPKVASRKTSAMGEAIGAAAGAPMPTVSDAKAGEKAAAAASVDFPGPATHPPTECTDADTHYDKILKDEIIPAPLGKVYSMVFGPASGGFMTKWLLDEIKVTELQMEDRRGLSEEVRTRGFSYIKPLYASIGPKTTKCIISETLDFIDLERSISVTSTTQTPDVPSGNVFRPIEKGANDGQTSYANDLVKALKAGVTLRPRAGTVGSKAKAKGKRPKGSPSGDQKTAAEEKVAEKAQAKDENWGLLEPLHGILGPVVDVFKPYISSNMVIGFLLFLIVFSWLRGPRTPAKGQLGLPAMSSSDRIAAYEEIWRREESELWDWLEERVGMQGIAYPVASEGQDQRALKKARNQREQTLKNQGVRAKLAQESMSDRQVDHAIQVTEERLRDLKEAVQKKRGSKLAKDEGKPDERSMPEAEGV